KPRLEVTTGIAGEGNRETAETHLPEGAQRIRDVVDQRAIIDTAGPINTSQCVGLGINDHTGERL
ncbi:hypothetical protein ACC695_40090, partial [Rhizobium ruizarguesonis]